MAGPDALLDDQRFRLTVRRLVWLVGALLTVLVLATVVTAVVGFRDAVSVTSTLQPRQATRTELDTAQRDVDSGEQRVIKSLTDPSGTLDTQALVAGQDQAQTGFLAWTQYVNDLTAHREGLAGLSSVSADLHNLESHPGDESGTAFTRASLTSLANVRVTALQQFDADLDAVRAADDQWWTGELASQHRTAVRAADYHFAVTGVALLAGLLIVVLAARAAGRRDATLRQREEDLRRVATASELEARLQRALEMATTEQRVYEIVEQAVSESLPNLHTELLLADSSRAHFNTLISTGLDIEHHCPVTSPADCPAAQRGQVLSFASSAALDTCVYLKQASPEPRSATCLPVSVGGMTYGVVHAAASEGALPNAEERALLDLIARRASDRVALLRAFSRSELQAGTDPLTGLPNRRALEERVHELTARDIPYAVAFADLDNFKLLNDTHGHGAGDRALRAFAEVLRAQVRPDDLVARYGGEEFVIVLPNCPTDQAMRVLQRIRESLASLVASAGIPAFTVSIGLAETAPGGEFVERVAKADSALLAAKMSGRDRVVIARPEGRQPVAV